MSRRREVTEALAGLAVLAVLFAVVRVFVAGFVVGGFFALPTRQAPAGGAVWSNLVASVICLLVAWWRLRTRMIAHHAAQLAQATLHHQERTAQADGHHEAQMALARDHHAAAERRHGDLVEHVTAAVALAKAARQQPARTSRRM